MEIRDKDETSVLSIKESGLDYFEPRSKRSILRLHPISEFARTYKLPVSDLFSTLALALAVDLSLSLARSLARSRSRCRSLALSRSLAHSLPLSLSLLLSLSLALALAVALSLSLYSSPLPQLYWKCQRSKFSSHILIKYRQVDFGRAERISMVNS